VITITVHVTDTAWQAAMDVLLAASAEQARKASLEGAEAIRDVARGKLTAQWHSRFSFSPSFPGAPPAAISGDLAASMDAQMMTADEAWVGPTAGFGRTGEYARIQELGGGMHGHPFMHFFLEGSWWDREFIELPDRPYLQPSTEDVIDSGRLHEIYERHQLEAILEATV
jgi:hypothetical protein